MYHNINNIQWHFLRGFTYSDELSLQALIYWRLRKVFLPPAINSISGCQPSHNAQQTAPQLLWIGPVISYLWMVGLVMRLFSWGANLWRWPANIQPKNGPAPWILFLTPAPRPLQATFLAGEAEHMCLHPFATQMCLQIWKFWASRSVEFSGLNGIVRVCYYFWPLNLRFAFRERPFVTSNMHLEINILCLTYANSASWPL